MAKIKRPLTQKEIQSRSDRGSRETITLANRSKQLITISCRPAPGVDFYIGTQDVHLRPGQRTTLPKRRIWQSQIDRLQKRGLIWIVSDSAKVMAIKKRAERKKKIIDRKPAQKAAIATKSGYKNLSTQSKKKATKAKAKSKKVSPKNQEEESKPDITAMKPTNLDDQQVEDA